MPSTFTTNNRLEKQAPGENQDSWGARLNSNTIDMLDEAIDGVLSFTLSGSKTLTIANGASDEARQRALNITGGSGGTITIPNLEKAYLVRNNCSGAVTITTGSGTTASVPTGTATWVFCDGSNSCYATGSGPNFGSMNISTTGSGSFGTLAVSATSTIAGRFDFSNGLRAQGTPLPASGAGLELRSDAAANTYIAAYNRSSTTEMTLSVTGSTVMIGANGAAQTITLSSTGCVVLAPAVKFQGIGTTASASNAYLDPVDNQSIKRSTSSARFKRDVETVEPHFADAILNLRPVWYRSTAQGDDPDWGWWGFVAEEAAEVDPRLVHWGYREEDWVEISHGEPTSVLQETGKLDSEGMPIFIETLIPPPKMREPRQGAKLVPDGFQYERLTVLLLDVVRRQNERLEVLEATIRS